MQFYAWILFPHMVQISYGEIQTKSKVANESLSVCI